MRRLAADLGYRLQKHRGMTDRWYLVESGRPISIVAQNLTLQDAAEHLLILGPAA